MIKIEFKEAYIYNTEGEESKIGFFTEEVLIKAIHYIRGFRTDIQSITPYIPTQDPMLDREHILTQLGITEQEDKLFQEQYKNV